MTREEEIINAATEVRMASAETLTPRGTHISIDDVPFVDKIITYDEVAENAFIKGAEWADENPNKKLVYTKKELLNMGFGFDLNGNIVTLQEIEEMTKKYINYQKCKWVKNACEWIKNNKHLYKVLSFGSLSTDWDKFIVDFHKAMSD